MVTRKHIVELAREWVGTPYRHQARVKGQHVDCIGLITGIADELGVNYQGMPTAYSKSPKGNLILQHCDRILVRTEKKYEDLVPGDVVVMWGYTQHEAQHFAIVSELGDRLYMIHAWSKHNKVVEHPWDDFWSRRIEAVYEFPGTEETY